MALWGGGVPWWRVIRADGSPALATIRRRRSTTAAEGTPLRGERVDMRLARWDGAPLQ